MSIKNLSADLFSANVNNERETLVAAGRVLMRDCAARKHNEIYPSATKISLKVADENEYSKMNEGFRRRFFNYAGKVAYAQSGKTWDEEKDFDALRSMAKAKDLAFLKVLADITSEIVSPMIPDVISDLMGAFANVNRVGYGVNKEFNIKSNAIFAFEDTAWGVRSQRAQYLYDKTIVARPRPASALTVINWYSYVAEGRDMGEYFMAIAEGIGSYVMGKFYKNFTAATANTTLLPSAYSAAAYDSENFMKIAQNVAIANRVTRKEVACFGTILALDKVIPDVASNTSGAYAMASVAGMEWLTAGFLSDYKGTPLFEIQNVFVPNTVNTSATHLISDTTLWFAALNGYKPCEVVFEGNDIYLDMTPSETEDFTIQIEATTALDVITIMGSKIGVITNVH